MRSAAAIFLVDADVGVVQVHFIISVIILHLDDDDLLDLNVSVAEVVALGRVGVSPIQVLVFEGTCGLDGRLLCP